MEFIAQQSTTEGEVWSQLCNKVHVGCQTAGRWGLGREGRGLCESIAHPGKKGQVRGGTGHYGNIVIS